MEKLVIDRIALLVTSGIAAVLIILGATIQGFSRSGILTEIGLILAFVTWIIVLVDIIRNPVRKKALWIVALFIANFITMVFYLFTRDRRMKANEKITK